ncbi:NG,NG-dimethylarginine dimethylaminohydrolase 1 [Lachnospiraceae bacterium TWA4]|nr:NG,NG-dimethylarginine dimethylaminohydrolase 1 [Lachnospiraceae bacterium TWA4]
MTTMNSIYVENEFSNLKKVIVAQSEFNFPLKTENTETEFLADSDMKNMAAVAGKSYAEAFPENNELWLQERKNLVNVLEKYGVEVLRPRLLTEYEKSITVDEGSSNFFIRDPFFTIGNYVIEGSLRFGHRRNEILPARKVITEQVYNSKVIYVSVPRPDISEGEHSEEGPFLEGGDILVYGKEIFVGNSGLASNHNGVMWLKHLLEPQGYHVTEVPLRHDVLHLDCAMSLVRDGLMIVSEEVFLKGVPEVFDSWDKIKVDAEQIKYLAINGLPINPEVYIADLAFKETIGNELEKRGIYVEYIDFHVSRSMGGSFRCSTQVLLRR